MYKPTTFESLAESYKRSEKFEPIRQLLLLASFRFKACSEIISKTKNSIDEIKNKDS